MTWAARIERLREQRGLRLLPSFGARQATNADFLHGLRTDPSFHVQLCAWLADAPYAAFCWETPPVTAGAQHRPFEFVVLDSPGLDRPADPSAFAEHLDRAQDATVVEFPNLGGDAILIAPIPIGHSGAYGHLAAFVRAAPAEQQHALWQRVGDALAARISANPVWLSTAGAGVPWLHVRLDERPKYYGYAPYRRMQ